MSGESKTLEPIVINNAPSYGNYVRMRGKNSYLITVQVLKSGASQPLEAKFEHRTF